MSRINELIRQVGLRDETLAADLRGEVAALADRRSFGLIFERHVPEAVELPGRPVRLGDKVRLLPPRGEKRTEANDQVWQVTAINRNDEEPTAELVSLVDEEETSTASVSDLVVVAEFRDPIYPGLVSTGKVERGGDKPFHTVINAENFHALEALLFTHRGKVDCIYIDPPYNTGAKDWKYNNDYVEGDDLYRHSKWLAFMERRLRLAKGLLNAESSALVVTIDEKEVLRLGLLLEQIFEGDRIQMVTTVTNQRGVARGQEFARVDEYALVVLVGAVEVAQSSDDLLTTDETASRQRIDIWNRLMRRGTDSQREDSPNQFYPIFIDPARKAIVHIGETVPLGVSRDSIEIPDGTVAVWPLRTNGTEGRWTVGWQTLRGYVKEGWVKVGQYNKARDQWSISYLISKDIERLETGELVVEGRDENGVLLIKQGPGSTRTRVPRTVWHRDQHNSGTYGSELLGRLIPGRRFPFPKSLYLVEDMLRVFTSHRADAVIVDFFAGSGTTAHAVMRLNRQDSGRRQCIAVSNNEVSADELKALRDRGLRPGDSEWEQHGICELIMKPRIEAAVTGVTSAGEPIKGDYKFTDEFPMADGFEENVEFFTLTYEAPLRVASNREFGRIAPLLWMRAGSRGRRIEEIPQGWDVAETYGVLADLDCVEPFLDALGEQEEASTAFIVTGEDRLFETVVRQLPDGVEPVRLYDAYLRNFEQEAGRGLK